MEENSWNLNRTGRCTGFIHSVTHSGSRPWKVKYMPSPPLFTAVVFLADSEMGKTWPTSLIATAGLSSSPI